ncbi:LOW QUALITY PROTEIN: hypothetical protein KUTeg_011580 [Tegillarca granosa]|uniref:Integrase catalytic domain-containing protein n=1 Tax=Tegillarca granosa TaxID=220873 RepID=A0ABQ9F0Q4_TEGGR|nr:LOW QUALITY PROTEIN: hypothetical protein KUTeg_011580 [Tegillarca granosa]
MLTSEEEDYLKSIWTDPKHPGAYAGPQKLYLIVKKEGKYKIGFRRIKQFLSDQDAYSLQKRVQRNFKRNRVIVFIHNGIWTFWMLVAQDVFSRYVSVVPMKNKSANETIRALELLLSKGRKPEIIRTDNGGVFQNKRVMSYLKERDIHQIFAQNETKSNYSERAIQNLKKKRRRPIFKFKINDKVRITYLRHPFRREYRQKWTGEVFKMYKRFVRDGLPVYKLRDFNDDIIRGTFMTQEMQKVNKDDNTIWKIDKILKQHKKNGEDELLVSWQHWPSKFNSWIRKSDVVSIYDIKRTIDVIKH